MTTSPAKPAPAKRALRGADVDRLVTGEGVLIEVPPTSVASLVIAAIIDYVVIFGVYIGSILALSRVASSMSAAQSAVVTIVLTVSAFLVVPVGIEVWSRGRSLGKLVMKLRVVRDDGGPITFRHAFVRGLIAIVEIWTLNGIPAVICAMISTRAKRIGDLAAGTYVVREETAMKLAPAPWMPPALIPWATGADMAALPDGLAMQIRQYLLRTGSLSPAAHEQIGRDMLGRVLPLVAPPPPREAPVDAVLAAVLGERRRRDRERLQREAALRNRLLS